MFKAKQIKVFFRSYPPDDFNYIYFLYFLSQDISNVLEKRDRILKIDNYGKEGRIVEFKLVLDKISNSAITTAFGMGELFNSANNYGFYSGDSSTYTRPIHNDYAMKSFWRGIHCFISVFVFLISLFLNILANRPSMPGPMFLLYNFNLFLIMILFLVGFSSGLTDVSIDCSNVFIRSLIKSIIFK